MTFGAQKIVLVGVIKEGKVAGPTTDASLVEKGDMHHTIPQRRVKFIEEEGEEEEMEPIYDETDHEDQHFDI